MSFCDARVYLHIEQGSEMQSQVVTQDACSEACCQV